LGFSKDIINARLKHVVNWSEYRGEPLDRVVELVKVGSKLAGDEWKRVVQGLSDDEILKFYSQSECYIYEVLQAYLNPEAYSKDVNYFKIVNS